MNSKNIILNDSAKIDLTCQGSLNDILIVGNFNGMFGRIDESGLDLSGEPSEEIINNFMWLNDTCRDAKKVFIGTRSSVGDYVKNMIAAAENLGIQINRDKYNIILVDSDDELLNKLNEISHTMPKFDYIIQNPPYAKTLHIDFFKKGIELLNDTGKMSIIEPATWLIDLKDDNLKTTSYKMYKPFKETLEGHVKCVEIENRNEEFKTGMYVPFSNILYARCGSQTSKVFCDKIKNNIKKIKFRLCGVTEYIETVFDANSIGKKSLIDSIISKISNSDNVSNHSVRRDKTLSGNYHYVRYRDIITNHGYSSNADKITIGNDIIREYYSAYIQPLIHHRDQEIYSTRPKNAKGNISECVYGTHQELTNYKHYVLNNTLPLFINICMTIDQHNNSLKYVPWLVDKQYTDQEIYEMFGFTEQEINLIEYTVEKFQYSSPFFKRYMCGPSKVSDQEVQDYIENLKKKHNIDY